MRKHSRGAVTVLVTLLLIPAVLVSGTGVDISRIYAARSTTRDANQLAANALMTNYDALLQDLYGLYGVIGDDDELTGMVDLYVRASLFGEDVTDAQLGEFRLFGGHEGVSSSVSGSEPLSDLDVLRRQIEEYSKYRVPVAIVSDIMDRLEDPGTEEMAANTQAAAKKLELDEQFEDTLTKFNDVIKKADEISGKYMADERDTYKSVNDGMAQIQYQFDQMLKVREEYEDAFRSGPDPEKEGDIRAHYRAISDNIAACANGGWIGYNWTPAHVDENGNDVPGAWDEPHYKYYDGLRSAIDRGVETLEGHSRDLDELVRLCQEADAAKGTLGQKIKELEEKLNDGGCSAELAENMGAELTDAKKLLAYDFTDLGERMKVKASDYIVSTSVPPLKKIEGYGAPGNGISFENLRHVADLTGYAIDLNVHPALHQGEPDRLSEIQHVSSVCTAPQRYPTFRSISGDHEECYDLIRNGEFHVKSDGELTEEEKQEKQKFTDTFKTLKDLWKGLTDYDPAPGQKTYSGSDCGWAFSSKESGLEMDFLLTDFNLDDSSESGIKGTLKTFTGLITGETDVMDMFGNVLANVTDRILLVGYDTQMFSNWSYKNMEGDAPKSLTGQPIDAKHNYFFNSEWEYLFNGSLDAGKNLGKATMTILVIRFLANYASSFMITQIDGEIKGMETAVSAVPYAGGVLRFLVRPLYVLIESVVDTSLLRVGYGVPLLKKEAAEWRFSLAGFVAGEIKDMCEQSVDPDAEKGKGLLYTDYLTVFLLVSDPKVLASRTADLIALNVGSVKAGSPSPTMPILDLSKARTTFEIKTSTQVRFMFLSMPFAQQGLNGVTPPTTFPVIVTDYRGY